MKKLLFLILIFALILISCNKNKKIITNGEWLESRVEYLNSAKTDSFATDTTRYKFCDNGDILENKYNFFTKYKINGDKFSFINHDTVTAEYNITKATNDEFIIENHLKIKYDKRDTVIYRKFVYKKTTPLPHKPYDSVLYNMAKLFNIGKREVLGNNSVFYTFDTYKFEPGKDYVYSNPSQIEPKIKGCVDKTLKILPKKETLQEFDSMFGRLVNSYEWETLEFIIKMENAWVFDDKDLKNKSYLKVKIWITEK